MKLSVEQLNEILSDLWNINLILLGVSLTIFTLLYSFILSKRDELRGISEQLKIGSNSMVLSQKESFAIIYISKLKSANNHAAIIILVTFMLFLFAWISLRIIPDSNINFKQFSVYLTGALTVVILIYSILIFVKIYKQYRFDTKI